MYRMRGSVELQMKVFQQREKKRKNETRILGDVVMYVNDFFNDLLKSGECSDRKT